MNIVFSGRPLPHFLSHALFSATGLVFAFDSVAVRMGDVENTVAAFDRAANRVHAFDRARHVRADALGSHPERNRRRRRRPEPLHAAAIAGRIDPGHQPDGRTRRNRR